MADPYFTPNRARLIDDILADLNSGKYQSESVAVAHLVRFFEAARSPFSYIWWLLFTAPWLKQYELLELTDLGNQKWNEMFYPLMIETERLPFPGLVAPLVEELSKRLSEEGIDHVLQLGSGPMEIERQVIENIKKFGRNVHFIGIDLSEFAHATAKQNLESAGIKVRSVNSSGDLKKLLSEKPSETSVTLYLGDGVRFLEDIDIAKNQLLFHSLFRHHLTKVQKEKLEVIIENKKIPTVEYDGFRSWLSRTMASLGTWGNPVFLNSAVISHCRYDTKKNIRIRLKNSVFNFPSGGYVAVQNIH